MNAKPILALILLPLCLAVERAAHAAEPPAAPAGQVSSAPVEILRDRWGIPHVFATTDAGAFYGLGYATAEDRAFQMTYSLRIIQGRLAETVGEVRMGNRNETSVDSDRKMRTFGFHRAAQRTAANLDPETRALLQAYTSLNNSSGLERTVAKLEALVRVNPADFSAALGLAEGYRALQKPKAAIRTLDQVVSHPQVDANTVAQAAQQYAAMTNHQKLAGALDQLTKLKPESPEVWYDVAALRAVLGKSQEAMPALLRAIELSTQRLKQDPKARDLQAAALQDSRFDSLRQLPEFKQLTAPR